MSYRRSLLSSRLRRYDRWVLLHHPEVWAFKVHWQILALPVAVVLAWLTAYVAPVRGTEHVPLLNWYGIGVLGVLGLGLVGITVWIAAGQGERATAARRSPVTAVLWSTLPVALLCLLGYVHMTTIHHRVHELIGYESLLRDNAVLRAVSFRARSGGRDLCRPDFCFTRRIGFWRGGDVNRTSVSYDAASEVRRDEWFAVLDRYSRSTEEQLRQEARRVEARFVEVLDDIQRARVDSALAASLLEGPALGELEDSLRLEWFEDTPPPFELDEEAGFLTRWGLQGVQVNLEILFVHVEGGFAGGEIISTELATKPAFWLLIVLFGFFVAFLFDAGRYLLQSAGEQVFAVEAGVGGFTYAVLAIGWQSWVFRAASPTWPELNVSHDWLMHLTLDEFAATWIAVSVSLLALAYASRALHRTSIWSRGLEIGAIASLPVAMVSLWIGLKDAHGGLAMLPVDREGPSVTLTVVIMLSGLLMLPTLQRWVVRLATAPRGR